MKRLTVVRSTLRPAFAVSVVLLLTGCDNLRENSALPEATSSQRVEEVGVDRHRVYPSSAPIEEGTAYRFKIQRHCGFDASIVDVDGSMWNFEPIEGQEGDEPGEGFADPDDFGTVTLQEDDRLRYESEVGGIAYFTRHHGPKIIPSCE